MNCENSFYICDGDYSLFVYETRKMAGKASVEPVAQHDGHYAAVHPAAGHDFATFWSRRLNSKVTFSQPNEPIFVIEKQDEYWHVIIGDKIGWIIADDWLKIKELRK